MQTTTIDIGIERPANLQLRLVKGAPFSTHPLMRTADEPWLNPPALAFGRGIVWHGTLNATRTVAVIVATKEQVAQVIDSDFASLHDPVTGFVYAVGKPAVSNGVPS